MNRQKYPLRNKYVNEFNHFFVHHANFNKSLKREDLNTLWYYFHQFPMPELVLEKLDIIWNKLILQKDKALANQFFEEFDKFIETLEDKKLLEDAKQKYHAYQTEWDE